MQPMTVNKSVAKITIAMVMIRNGMGSTDSHETDVTCSLLLDNTYVDISTTSLMLQVFGMQIPRDNERFWLLANIPLKMQNNSHRN